MKKAVNQSSFYNNSYKSMAEESGTTTAQKRASCIPVLYTRGTHFEIGLDIGRTFRTSIENFLAKNVHLNNVLVEKYQSAKVRRVYEESLRLVTSIFPQYVEELKGIAQGAKVPFFKLYLLHIDDIISTLCGKEPYGGLMGSTSVCCDESKVILGHSCDGGPELINGCYLVVAHALEAAPRGSFGVAEERFTAFCLPGMLPGPYMGYNQHGLVMSVNSISTGIPDGWTRTPRHFLCRALLSCSNMFDACEILSADGSGGTSDGISVNMIFARQEGATLIHNAEVAPPPVIEKQDRTTPTPSTSSSSSRESVISVLTLSPGEHLTHCNKFLRLKTQQRDSLPLWSSNHRHAVLGMLPRVLSMSSVVAVLGDQTDVMFSFFRDGGGKDEARTIATGIFNLTKKTWSVYTQNPKNSLPVIVLPMNF